MADVYVVEVGEYSGRYVFAVFREREDADACARANDGSVSEFDFAALDDEDRKYLRPGMHLYHVTMNADGSESGAHELWADGPQCALSVRIGRSGEPERFAYQTWAKSEAHAIKILNEHRSAWLTGPRPIDERQPEAYNDRQSWQYGWRTVPSSNAMAADWVTEACRSYNLVEPTAPPPEA